MKIVYWIRTRWQHLRNSFFLNTWLGRAQIWIGNLLYMVLHSLVSIMYSSIRSIVIQGVGLWLPPPLWVCHEMRQIMVYMLSKLCNTMWACSKFPVQKIRVWIKIPICWFCVFSNFWPSLVHSVAQHRSWIVGEVAPFVSSNVHVVRPPWRPKSVDSGLRKIGRQVASNLDRNFEYPHMSVYHLLL